MHNEDHPINITHKKLIYQIIAKGPERIVINKYINIELKLKDVFRIYVTVNKHLCILNDTLIQEFSELYTLNYCNHSYYALSTVLSVSLENTCHHTKQNFDYVRNKYLDMMKTSLPNMQLCVCHTEKTNEPVIDNIIESSDINYIFVKNPFHFNIGYCRNLWRYVCNSDKIMYADIDISLDLEHIMSMLEKSKQYDIIKPYHRRLLFTTLEEKTAYLETKTMPERNTPFLGTITGGIVLFDKKVLMETGGYEEFNCYGLEDRCFDVVVLNKKYTIFKIANKLLHLYHDKRKKTLYHNYHKMSLYMKKYYNCLFYKKEYKYHLHEHCKHKKDMSENIAFNRKYNGDLTLFKHPVLSSLVLKNKW